MTSEPATSNAAEITRRAKSNLAFAFLCVPRERRADLNTFYAFCRVVDDIADDTTRPKEEKKAEKLQLRLADMIEKKQEWSWPAEDLRMPVLVWTTLSSVPCWCFAVSRGSSCRYHAKGTLRSESLSPATPWFSGVRSRGLGF